MFIDEQMERELQTLAQRRGRPVASLVREAVNAYIVEARANAGAPLSFTAVGRSGQQNIAEQHEELVFAELQLHDGRSIRRTTPSSRRRQPLKRPGAARAIRPSNKR